MEQIDWSKAPPHATHWCPGNARIEAGWIYNIGGEFYSCYADKGLEHIPAFPAWREEKLIQRPPKQTWTGTGLPPVGTVCERRFHDTEGSSWNRVTVTAHGHKKIMCLEESGDEWAHYALEVSFRPARTPEQIAAEQREKDIEEMLDLFKSTACKQTYDMRGGIAALFDAGFRKFEIVPE